MKKKEPVVESSEDHELSEALKEQVELIKEWYQAKTVFPTVEAFEREVVDKLNSITSPLSLIKHNGFKKQKVSIQCKGCK